jgi:hypothetical protein
MAGQPGAEPVDRPFNTASQHSGPECVEVVLTCEHQQRGDALELGVTAGGRGEQFTQFSPPTSSGRVRAGRVTPTRLAADTAVRPYRATVTTMTRNVTGRISDAPRMCRATSPAENVDAVAAR